MDTGPSDHTVATEARTDNKDVEVFDFGGRDVKERRGRLWLIASAPYTSPFLDQLNEHNTTLQLHALVGAKLPPFCLILHHLNHLTICFSVSSSASSCNNSSQRSRNAFTNCTCHGPGNYSFLHFQHPRSIR